MRRAARLRWLRRCGCSIAAWRRGDGDRLARCLRLERAMLESYLACGGSRWVRRCLAQLYREHGLLPADVDAMRAVQDTLDL